MFERLTEPFNQIWEQLSERDKKAASLLLVSLFVAILIFGLVLPIHSHHQQARQALITAQNVFEEIVTLAPQAMAMGNNSDNIAPAALNNEIRRQAVRMGVTIQRFEPDGDNLRVWLEGQTYQSVINWLASLETVGVRHTEGTLEKGREPGLISARFTFTVR